VATFRKRSNIWAGQVSKRYSSAHAGAIVSLNAALELLQKMADGPERTQHELLLHVTLGQALLPIKGFSAPEVERAFTRARELCERLGDPPELFFVLLGLRGVYFIRGEYRLASELDQKLLLQAQSAKDPGLLSLAHWLRGITYREIGERPLARKQLEKSIFLYDRERDRPRAFLLGVDPGCGSLGYLGMILWTLGYPDQALKRGQEGVALAEGLVHQLCANEVFLFVVHQRRGEADKAQRAAENVITLSDEHGFTLWSALATFLRHWAIIEQGQGDGNISQLREALAAYRATEAQVGRSGNLCMLAEACMKTGRLDDASDALTEALAVADQHEEHHGDAEIHRLRGELALKKEGSNVAAAQRCFERAIEVAQKQSAKSFELRATMSLARLLAQQGHRREPRAMLAEIYGWFTEGFDTADLKDAKALLEELKA
jgi:predicted ATPase